MKKYRKFIAAVVGLSAIVLNDFVGLDAGTSNLIADSILGVLTAFGVYQLPNAQA
ncbi:MAG: hypothetical protein ACR2RE_14685 [Geminicoccaceae bacterium]